MNNSKDGAKTIISLIGGDYWVIPKGLALVIGTEASIWLAEIFWQHIRWSGQLTEGGYFFQSGDKIQQATGLNKYKQKKIRKKLKPYGIVKWKRIGLQQSLYYKPILSKIVKFGKLINEKVMISYRPSFSLHNVKSRPNKKPKKSNSCSELKSYNQGKNLNLGRVKKRSSPPLGIGSGLSNTVYNKNQYNNNSSYLSDKKFPFPQETSSPVSGIPSKYKELIDFWNSCGLQQHKDPNRQVYKSTILFLQLLMKGSLFNQAASVSKKYWTRKFTKEEIIRVVRSFALAAKHPEYGPSGIYKERLMKTSFKDFLFNRNARKERSLFIKYFENPVEVTIDYPEYTKALMKFYQDEIIGKVEAKFSRLDLMKFRNGGVRTKEFFDKNESRIHSMFIKTPKDRCKLVIESIKSQWGKTATVGNVSSDYTYDVSLPQYLNNQGVVSTPFVDLRKTGVVGI